ncbi:hypothetical protein ACFXDH_21635 [Streptomyces sp. NPDC059467]|uniref:hypothetical protein n=1 Tax=Streptomyces sp. NPDC059467 TaxID=3346844 RepID=UPI0036907CE9
MSIIDDLLAQSLLLPDPKVPSDVVPYDDVAHPGFTDDGLLLWDGDGPDLADDGAARSLAALCEAVVAHCTPDQLADFLTDQLPQPRAAWILGCALQLAGAHDGARFWWQYAAGAGDEPPSYCLYLQHLARGDTHAAALWQAQAETHAPDGDDAVCAEDAPAHRMVTADTSLSTVLRILSRLTQAAPRRHTPTATAVIDFVATAVAIGYDLHPDLEIPVPGPNFAEHLEIIVAATALPPSRSAAAELPDPGAALPNRPTLENTAERTPEEPERLLVEVTAADHEPESASAFFKAAVAVCWRTVTAARTPAGPDGLGTRRAYYLDRFRPRTPRTRPTGFGTMTPSPAGVPRPHGL